VVFVLAATIFAAPTGCINKGPTSINNGPAAEKDDTKKTSGDASDVDTPTRTSHQDSDGSGHAETLHDDTQGDVASTSASRNDSGIDPGDNSSSKPGAISDAKDPPSESGSPASDAGAKSDEVPADGSGTEDSARKGCIDALFGRYLLRVDGAILLEDGKTPIRSAQTGLPLSDAIAVQDGNDFGCAVFVDGSVECWPTNAKGNDLGQLGSGDFEHGVAYRAAPVLISDEEPLQAVRSLAKASVDAWPEAANNTACALLEDGSAYCWGDVTRIANAGTTAKSPYAQAITADGLEPLTNIKQLALGGSNSACAVIEGSHANELRCWGMNNRYNLGTGDTVDVAYPEKVLVVEDPQDDALASRGNGGYFATTCTVDGGQVRCWGDNGGGTCGIGSADKVVTSPTYVKLETGAALDDVVQIYGGGGGGYLNSSGPAVCALRSNQTLWCWGTGFTSTAKNVGATNVVSAAFGGGALRFVTSNGVYNIKHAESSETVEPLCDDLE
jgi:hypothetical protein